MINAAKNLITATLLAITDLRPIDWDSGKRLPITIEECSECERCGRLHAVVWTVEVTETGKPPRVFNVGSTCGKRMVAEGLLPEFDKIELREARKAKRTREQEEIDAKLAEIGKVVADKAAELMAAGEPEIVRLPDVPAVDSTDKPVMVMGMGDASVWCLHGQFDDERERWLRRSWTNNRIKEAAADMDIPGMFSLWQVVNSARSILVNRKG
jgi:hypothetical protein